MARVVFMGTPEPAARILEAIHFHGHSIPLVVTQPDKRRGRGSAVTPSPVKEMAQSIAVPVTDTLADVRDVEADLGVVVAYGKIIPTGIIEQFPLVNVHFSLLPRWRGAAPVERAILAGDTETGVAIMAIAEKLDEGDVYASASTSVGNKSAADLLHELTGMGIDLLMPMLAGGFPESAPQRGEATYAAKLSSEDRHVRLTSQTAEEAERIVRIGDAWATIDGRRLKILSAELVDNYEDGVVVKTVSGLLRLNIVQPEGKRPMSAADWKRGLGVDTVVFDE